MSLFNSENYYFCPECGNYSCEIVSIDDRDYLEIIIYECVLCGEKYDEVVYY